MLVQNVGNDLVDGRVVSEPLIAAKLQEMDEIGERELICSVRSARNRDRRSAMRYTARPFSLQPFTYHTP